MASGRNVGSNWAIIESKVSGLSLFIVARKEVHFPKCSPNNLCVTMAKLHART